MVLAYYPQHSNQSLSANSNYSPQGIEEKDEIPGKSLKVLFPPIGDLEWNFYKFYQINRNKVPTLQNNMPLAIVDTLPPGAVVHPLGYDIRSFDSTGNVIPQDNSQVKFNPDASADIVSWIDSSIVSDLEFTQLIFGNIAVIPSPLAHTWLDYVAVYHMNQLTFGVNTILDSTTNNNHGSTSGFPNFVNGKIGRAYRTNGTGKVTIPNTPSIDIGVNDFTIELWFETFSAGDNLYGLVEKKLNFNGNNIGWQLWADFRDEDKGLVLRLNDGSHTLDQTFNFGGNARSILKNNGLHYVVVTYDATTKIIKLYIDKILGDIGVYTMGTGDFSNTEPVVIADRGNPDMTIDEVRLSNVIRSSDWVTTQYNNQNDNDAFWHKTPLLENGTPKVLVEKATEKRIEVVGN